MKLCVLVPTGRIMRLGAMYLGICSWNGFKAIQSAHCERCDVNSSSCDIHNGQRKPHTLHRCPGAARNMNLSFANCALVEFDQKLESDVWKLFSRGLWVLKLELSITLAECVPMGYTHMAMKMPQVRPLICQKSSGSFCRTNIRKNTPVTEKHYLLRQCPKWPSGIHISIQLADQSTRWIDALIW